MNKPNDILEFLRGQAEPKPEPEPPKSGSRPPEASDLTLHLTRRQQIIAGAVALLALLLAGLIGSTLAGTGPDAAAATASAHAKVWVIRAVSYRDTEANRVRAREIAQWLERRGLAQATLRRLPKQNLLVVVLGAWIENPVEDLAAQKLVRRVQNLDWKGDKPFHGAFLWQISVR